LSQADRRPAHQPIHQPLAKSYSDPHAAMVPVTGNRSGQGLEPPVWN
jgi:hypothetical protein